MLCNRNIDRRLWTEAVSTACHILNRVNLNHAEEEVPYEKWFKQAPEVNHMRIFGAAAYTQKNPIFSQPVHL